MLGSANTSLNMQLLSLLLLGLSPSLVMGFPKFKWPTKGGGGSGDSKSKGVHGEKSYCGPSNPPNLKHNKNVAECQHGDKAVSMDSCYKMLDTITNTDYWKTANEVHEVLHAAGCGFSIKVTGTNHAVIPKVGIDDAIYLVNKTMEQCNDNGKVGGVGIMTCDDLPGPGATGKVVWHLEPYEPKD